MVKKTITPVPSQPEAVKAKPRAINWAGILSWGGTLLLVAVMLAVLLQINPFNRVEQEIEPVTTVLPDDINLPIFNLAGAEFAIVRPAELDTTIPEGQRQFAIKYTVEEGDSIFAIAKKFDITPETILWANYDLLNDDPTFIKPGWRMTIPPTDGIYYKWKQGDSLQKIADTYKAELEDIVRWPSNKLDITNPVTDGLEYVMIPGGYREIRSWIVPLAYTSGSGATRVIAGGCQTNSVYVGSGAFLWPTGNRSLSGFDFTSYHLAIDISAQEGSPVYASDYGTVIYSDWNGSGYGNLIVIDHGNGYETLYAHLSNLYVSCGEGVVRGQAIAAAGNTGKSTGAHLHFEVRYLGGFVNPWSVLQ